jgi:hypothetical protein
MQKKMPTSCFHFQNPTRTLGFLPLIEFENSIFFEKLQLRRKTYFISYKQQTATYFIYENVP